MHDYVVSLITGIFASLVLLSFVALGVFALTGGLGSEGGDLVNAAARATSAVPPEFM
jgi:hypothetical protein